MKEITASAREKIIGKLCYLYGENKGKATWLKLEKMLNEFLASYKCEATEVKPEERFTEKDSVLITYANSFYRRGEKPLKTLNYFLQKYLAGAINGVHILPFFPYSSDRGFSVIDFYHVKEEFGTWQDIELLGNKFRLMVDLLLNHVSTQNEWFKRFLDCDARYKDYFISFSGGSVPEEEIKKVFRPRATPLLTKFKTKCGEKLVWTTFSVGNTTDQVDLNYKNPEVLLEIIKVLLFLLEKNAQIIRLDAVAYIWKELGTNCIHRPQAHTIVQLFRDILDTVKPSAVLITETNVPHKENISYFGNGYNEAQAVYNFSLPPLVLHAFWKSDASYLSKWASSLKSPSNTTTFFNFLDSHDGIGVLGARGILPQEEIERMFEEVEKRGGVLSYKVNEDGARSVYEMNITWWSALNGNSSDSLELQVQRFLCSRAIALALKGIPGIYYISLFGIENDLEGMRRSGVVRDINRKNLDIIALEEKLSNKESKEARVFWNLLKLIKVRAQHRAFHPNAEQEVLFLSNKVFALLRTSCNNKERILALHNLSKDEVNISLPAKLTKGSACNMLQEKEIELSDGKLELKPYEVQWLLIK